MTEVTEPRTVLHPTRIEPHNRLVVLARSIQVSDSEIESALVHEVRSWQRFGNACLGRALYRHRSIFQNTTDTPVWSHLELSYFREMIPASVISQLVPNRESHDITLLRAEILLTTPSSFIVPHGWEGSASHPERLASLEYIKVQSSHLLDYRLTMRDYCGPAALKLIQRQRLGTFRAMETAVVLFHAPRLTTDWNQIHLCELDPNGFEGFGKEFAAALRIGLPNGGGAPDCFADLGRIRTVPRWTFNDFVVEADSGVAREYEDASR